jgi:PAS domain S-box-containing protein
VEPGTGRFLAVNPTLCAMLGRTEQEMLATTFLAITHPEDLHLHEEKTAQLLAGEIEHYSLEKRYLRKDGGIVWVEITVSPLWIPGETPGRNITVYQNITERKRMKEESDRYSLQMSMLHDTSVELTAELNLDTLLHSIAQQALNLIGGESCNCFIYRSELDLIELVATAGENLANSGKMRRRGEGAVGQVWATGTPLLINDYHTWPGRKREYDHLPSRTLMLMPVHWGEEFLGVINMLAHTPHRYTEADVEMLRMFAAQASIAIHNAQLYDRIKLELAERKRAVEENRSLEERLQRSEKMEALGQLAGGVAHDLNNVLGIMSGYSELLLDEIPEGNRARVHVGKILQSTEKGAAIIQDLLTLARRGVMASEVINLNSIVSGFLKTLTFEKIQDYHPRVTFRAEFDKNLLNIKGSPIHLEKTVMNLISNAAEAISSMGKVIIRTESRYLDKPVHGYDTMAEGDYAVLTISDTGTGIPAASIGKIFEPFYTKKSMGRSGTGLGLAIVWGTVKDHNGYIDVQSEVDQGTTFTLYFPVTREELVAQQQKVPIEQYMGKGESVLVVDDIAEQRDVAARLLIRLGYEVHVVSSGEDAVEYLKGNNADILVLDMIMTPGIDGLETYERILKINPKQKAIIVSGFSDTDRVKEAQKLGAGAYLKKPYIMEKIGVAIRDELNRK